MIAETEPLVLVDPPFVEWASIPRLSRDMVVTEKIDGTNASIAVLEDDRVLAGSRSRWVTPADDNFGFARWVYEHADELRTQLGYGTHYGEWWGQGIQRKYGLDHKRFSLFNVSRWNSERNNRTGTSTVCIEAPLCHVVPKLYAGAFDTAAVDTVLEVLASGGSVASPGFLKPEGIVVWHTAARILLKKTLDKNDGHKGA